jgi:hypothetical protein
MNTNRRALFIFGILTILVMIASSSCFSPFVRPWRDLDADILVDELIEAGRDESQKSKEDLRPSSDRETTGDDTSDDDTGEGDDTEGGDDLDDALTVPEWFRVKYTEKYNIPEMTSLDEYTAMIGLGNTEKENLDIHIDVEGNNVWGGGLDVEGVPPQAEGFADIIFSARGTLVYPPEYTGLPVNGFHTCGSYNYDVPTWVTCPQGFDSSGINEWHMLVLGFKENIPIQHETHYGTVAAAMVPDDDPNGLWVPMPEYPQDHFGGTKWWLINRYEVGMPWTSQAYNSNWEEIYVPFFTVFYKNIVIFYMSADAFALPYPYGRGTNDWSNPVDWMGTFSGDVEGGDATLAPLPWLSSARASFTNETGALSYLPPGYEHCSYGGCLFFYEYQLTEDPYGKCSCIGCTSNPGCDCYVLSREWNPVLANNQEGLIPVTVTYDYVADRDQKVPYTRDLIHDCLCLKKTQ